MLTRAGTIRLIFAFALAAFAACGSDEPAGAADPGDVAADAASDAADADATADSDSPDTGDTARPDADAPDTPGADTDAGDDAGIDTSDVSSDAPDGDAGTEGMSMDAFCDLLVPRARDWTRTCRPGFSATGQWWGEYNIDLLCSAGRDAVEAGRLVWDGEQAAACAEASVGDCDDIEAFAYPIRGNWITSDACAGVLAPAVPLGESCRGNSNLYTDECVEGFCSTDACPGTCTAFSSVGESCDGLAARCAPESAWCDEGTCADFVALGEACDLGEACGPSAYCLYIDAAGESICVRSAEQGDACDADSGDVCEDGGVCVDGTCVAEVGLGERCEGDINCPDGAGCNVTTQLCELRVALGESCEGGVPCAEDTYCNSDWVCAVSGAAGEPCPCGNDLWCDASDTCRTFGGIGDDCTQPTEDAAYVRCEGILQCVPSAMEGGVPTAYACDEPGDLGEPCLPRFAGSCAWPLFCEQASYTCASPAAAGGACNPATPRDGCDDGLYCACTDGCDGDLLDAVGACEPLGGETDACTQPYECGDGLLCDRTINECVVDGCQ